MHRSILKIRIVYLCVALGTIGLGLLARKVSYVLADGVNLWLGDALYAMMIFWFTGCFSPRLALHFKLILAFTFCFWIELSQLVTTGFLLELRQTYLGKLVLGEGFLWSDIIAYSFGVSFGGVNEIYFVNKIK